MLHELQRRCLCQSLGKWLTWHCHSNLVLCSLQEICAFCTDLIRTGASPLTFYGEQARQEDHGRFCASEEMQTATPGTLQRAVCWLCSYTEWCCVKLMLFAIGAPQREMTANRNSFQSAFQSAFLMRFPLFTFWCLAECGYCSHFLYFWKPLKRPEPLHWVILAL